MLITGILPFARAGILPSDCSHLGGWQYEDCENILGDESLSLDEKEDLYLNLLANQGKLPSHEFAWGWNEGLVWDTAPSDVVPKKIKIKACSPNKF